MKLRHIPGPAAFLPLSRVAKGVAASVQLVAGPSATADTQVDLYRPVGRGPDGPTIGAAYLQPP